MGFSSGRALAENNESDCNGQVLMCCVLGRWAKESESITTWSNHDRVINANYLAALGVDIILNQCILKPCGTDKRNNI